MSSYSKKSIVGNIIMILLAWLGLAGLTDAIVEWQAWFEQGVMQHWRSVKEWVIAVLLWWVPFRIPTWIIDYIVIGAIFVRTSPISKWNEGWHFGPKDTVKKYGYVPARLKAEMMMSQVVLRWPVKIMIFFIWPILIFGLPVIVYEYLTGKPIARGIERDQIEYRTRVNGWVKRLVWCFVSFVPVLFVCSRILYEHG